jgi:hypothetical protein
MTALLRDPIAAAAALLFAASALWIAGMTVSRLWAFAAARAPRPTLTPKDAEMNLEAISKLIADGRQLIVDVKPLIADVKEILADVKALVPAPAPHQG